MPLSPRKIPVVNTLPILSVAASFTYLFDLQSNNTIQLLWTSVVLTTDATVGNRRMFLQISDENANIIFNVNYFSTQAASSTVRITFAQGLTIIPTTVLGRQTTLPADGLFVKDKWTLTTGIFPGISAGDVFSGFFQTRGLHNSDAP